MSASPVQGQDRIGSLVAEVLSTLRENLLGSVTSTSLARDIRQYDSEIPMKVEILRHVEREMPLERVLEIGAYFGLTSCCVRRLGAKQVWALDTTKAYADEDHKALLRTWEQYGLKFVDSDVSDTDWRLDFPDAFFDCVLVPGVIEHLPHSPRRLLEEAWRVVRPGGALILTTPNAVSFAIRAKVLLGRNVHPMPFDEFFEAERWFGHHREYDRHQVRDMLERTGFRVEAARCVDVPLRRTGAGARSALFRAVNRIAALLVPGLRAGLFFLARRPAEQRAAAMPSRTGSIP